MTTRFERIVAELTDYAHDVRTSNAEYVDPEDTARRILAIADSRVLWTPAECSAYIGREQPVWANWRRRRSHDVPTPAFRTSSGAMYDAEDVQEWASRPECYALLGRGSRAALDCIRGR